MSIEWLLTKTGGAEAQSRPAKTSDKQEGLSDKTRGSKSSKLKRAAEEGDEERPCRSEFSTSAEMQNRTSEINFRCMCGYEGVVNDSTIDFKLLRMDKKGMACYECSNCGRHFQYDSSTGQIKFQKGLLGFLFGTFS